MVHKRLRPALILTAVAVLAGFSAQSGTPLRADVQDSGLIPQPEQWVALAARSERVFESGRVMVGRYYRASDGSSRFESGPSFDEITAIGINNVPRRTHYRWTSQTGCTEQPMELPPGGWRPPRRRISAAETILRNSIEGFDVVKTERGDLTMLEAPQLNWLVLLEVIRNCGGSGADCRRRYSEIRLGEQRPELFEPLTCDTVTRLTDPGGIVRRN